MGGLHGQEVICHSRENGNLGKMSQGEGMGEILTRKLTTAGVQLPTSSFLLPSELWVDLGGSSASAGQIWQQCEMAGPIDFGPENSSAEDNSMN